MKTNNFVKRLSAICRIIKGKGNNLPILDCFYVGSDTITFTCLDVWIKIKHSLPIISKDIVCDASQFIKCLSSIDGLFTISQNDALNVEFLTKDSKTSLKGHPVGDFPEFPKMIEVKNLLSISATDIQILKTAKRYTDDDYLRPVMTCVAIDDDFIVSSDAHKLLFHKIDRKNGSVLIPKKVINLMILNEYSSFEVFICEKWVYAKSEKMEIYWRNDIINYLNWRSVIPNALNSIVVPINSLIDALKSVSLALNGASHVVMFELSKDKLTLSTYNDDDESYSEKKVDVFNPEKYALRWGFKYGVILDILTDIQNIGQTQTTIKFKEATNAFIIGEEFLLMPMMLND